MNNRQDYWPNKIIQATGKGRGGADAESLLARAWSKRSRELPVPGRPFGPLGAKRLANQTLDRRIFLQIRRCASIMPLKFASQLAHSTDGLW